MTGWGHKAAVAMTALLACAGAFIVPVGGPVAGAVTSSLVTDPASLVNPMDGTGTGNVNPGTIGEFPGADTPFGMMQWSPDTVPDSVSAGGGYAYGDSHVNGFSLTHLSGTGCPSYQDVPILPTVGSLRSDPATLTDSFSHQQEAASPGRYHVDLGPAPIGVSLAVTTRTGIGSFIFPRTLQANFVFKLAVDANPVISSQVKVLGDEVEGSVTSGGFCQTGTNYTTYFVARFDRPFANAVTWPGSAIGTPEPMCSGPRCVATVTFDTEHERTVRMKVGISFVSEANAAQNLRAEDPGWSETSVAAKATRQWNTLLRRIDVGGGTHAQQTTFYTALYHSLLFPNVVSDANGEYIGEDSKLHTDKAQPHFANFSEWDIYRGETQLESMLAPAQVSAMVQSLVEDAQQSGWLPKWAIVDGDESQMNGDSADPIITDAYAFGARSFDTGAALAAMVKGATQTESGHGLEIERQYLSQYLTQHYVNAGSLDLTSIDYSIGGSVTLEYAIDDFAIAQLASALGQTTTSSSMMQRAQNWEYLFDPSTGYIQARNSGGSFDAGPAFSTSELDPGGQTGFEEGNAIQYTWAVPQDLAALSTLMGGDKAVVAKLNTFFTQLNATRNAPYDWAGNEPSLWTPWEYDYVGAPFRTEEVVRQIADTLYADAPVDEPGNDDLGAIASWYVWAAIGLYPVTPGTANLALGSPLFPVVDITLGNGRHLLEHAPAASANTPYIHSLRVTGIATPATRTTTACVPAVTHTAGWNVPWLPASALRSGGTLDFDLSSSPDPSWGASPGASPPSFTQGLRPAVGFSFPSGGTTVRVGQSIPIEIGVDAASATPTIVHWSINLSGSGLAFPTYSGTLDVGDQTALTCTSPRLATESLNVTGLIPGLHALEIDLRTSSGRQLPPIVIEVDVT